MILSYFFIQLTFHNSKFKGQRLIEPYHLKENISIKREKFTSHVTSTKGDIEISNLWRARCGVWKFEGIEKSIEYRKCGKSSVYSKRAIGFAKVRQYICESLVNDQAYLA